MNIFKMDGDEGGIICGIYIPQRLIFQELAENLYNIEYALDTHIECPVLVQAILKMLNFYFNKEDAFGMEIFRESLNNFLSENIENNLLTYDKILTYIREY